MDHLSNAIQGVINLLDMLGGAVRRTLSGAKHSTKEEWRSRDNTWVGVAVLVVLGLFVVFLLGCGEQSLNSSSENTVGIETAKGEVAAADTLLTEVALNCCIPVTAEDLAADYMLDHNVPPMARLIADGGKPDLSKDAEALMLLDSMVNGYDSRTRRFYFWVVSRSLKWSDGYYSEGVGNMGTSYLFKRPEEFLTAWIDLLTARERDQWSYYLAGEQAIVSEGYPCDTVMRVFSSRLNAVIPHGDERAALTGDRLVFKVDSVLRLFKAEEN